MAAQTKSKLLSWSQLIVMVLILSCSGCQSLSRERTDFPAPDKKKHYEAGYLIGTMSLPILPLGLLAGTAAGIGKEMYDCIFPGTPELEDAEFTINGAWDGYLHTWERSFYGLEQTH